MESVKKILEIEEPVKTPAAPPAVSAPEKSSAKQ
jgi:hypothetical protein